jgi:hypothetical protein
MLPNPHMRKKSWQRLQRTQNLTLDIRLSCDKLYQSRDSAKGVKMDNIEETITNEELRRQIKGNLEIAADTWPIHQLRVLEDSANQLAMAGLYAEGLLYNGLMATVKLLYDKDGKLSLSSNPDDDNNIFKVLGEQIAANKKTETEADAKTETKTEANKPFFF